MSDNSGSGFKKAALIAKEAPKKLHRILIRKLPVRGFTLDDFNTCIDRVCHELHLNKDCFLVEHFVEGKISRKRGPVFGAGFVTISNETEYVTFMQNCPFKCPFIAVDDLNSQPEVLVAPNQRSFKIKEKVDKYASTLETDPDFLAFKAKLEKPVEKLPSAELQYDHRKDGSSAAAALAAEQMRSNPLLRFLREKGERKMAEKRAARDKARGLVATSLGGGGSAKALKVTGVLSKSGVSRTKKRSSASREAADGGDDAGGSSKPGKGSSKRKERAKRDPGDAGAAVKILARSLAAADGAGRAAPLSTSLQGVAPISRGTGDSAADGPPKLSRKEREREKERRKQERAAAAGDPTGQPPRPPAEPCKAGGEGDSALPMQPRRKSGRGGGRGGGAEGNESGGRGGGGRGGRGGRGSDKGDRQLAAAPSSVVKIARRPPPSPSQQA